MKRLMEVTIGKSQARSHNIQIIIGNAQMERRNYELANQRHYI